MTQHQASNKPKHSRQNCTKLHSKLTKESNLTQHESELRNAQSELARMNVLATAAVLPTVPRDVDDV